MREAFTTTLMVAIAILKLVQLPPASAFPGYRHLMTLVICINLPSQLVAVSGSSGGFSLEVNKGTQCGVGLMLVNVNNQGNSATHSITGSSYRSWSFDWTAPNLGAGLVTFEVAGMTSNGNGGNSGDRWTTNVIQVPENIAVNNPPSVANVLLNPTNAVTTDSLTLSYSFSDPDNDQESGSEIIWYRDSQALPQGAIVGLSVPSSETAKGQEWYATVKPSDGSDFGTLVSE